jgi:hypothetical protein
LFGITIAAIATSSYALDAYRDHANEIFIMAMVFKNFFFYGLSNFINNWFAADGPTQAFNVMGGISAALVRYPAEILKLTCSVLLRFPCTSMARDIGASGIDTMSSRFFTWKPIKRNKLLHTRKNCEYILVFWKSYP